MNTKFFKRGMFAAATSLLASVTFAASVNVNGTGSTFTLHLGSGFTGAEGAQRQAALEAAAQIWADVLVSTIPIEVDVNFLSSLQCNSVSGVLGYASPAVGYMPSGAEAFGLESNVIYPFALLNAAYAADQDPGVADIDVALNEDLGDADCLAGGSWYYGTDGNGAVGQIDLYETMMHELGHGLGILSLIQSNGSDLNFIPDIYTKQLQDAQTGVNWKDMNGTQRLASVTNDGNVVWNGAEVTAIAGSLTDGKTGGKVRMYAPSGFESGSSISHFDVTLTPDELMEPQYTGGATYDHSTALLKDIGWDVVSGGNSAPVITGQSALTTAEETDITLALGDFTVTDSDHTYPTGFTLTVNSGSNYTVSGNTVSPATDFVGTLTVPVTVNDSVDDSASFNASITVTNVNDAPVIASQNSISTNEDNSRLLTVSDFNITDPDDSSFTLSVGTGSNYSVSGNTVTPSANFNGTLTVPVTVNDGEASSSSFNASVTVNSVNDAPSITGLPTVSVNEDDNVALTVGQFTISDVDDSSFTLTVQSGSNYTLIGNTVYPATDFNGSLSVDVYVNDGETNSASETLTITVDPVNDAPEISGTPATSVVVSNAYSATFSATDVDDSSFTYSVVSNHSWLSINNSGVLSGTPSAGDIGAESVTVTVSDGALTDSDTFTLTVMDANSADLTSSMSVSKPLALTNENITVTTTVENLGPKATADGTLVVTVGSDTDIVSVDTGKGCTVLSATQMECDFTALAGTDSFDLVITSTDAQTDRITSAVTGVAADPSSANDGDALSVITVVTIEDVTPTASGNASANSTAGVFANVDGDNRSDFVSANDSSTGEQIFQLSNAFDSMTLDSTFSQNADSRDVATVDFDKNGELDVIFANNGANHLYLNTNGFSSPVSFGSDDSNAMVLVDVNGDTFIDVIVANNGANQVYLNDQSGDFVTSQSFGSANSSDIAVIDYNADTWPDVVVTNRDDDDLVYLNNGADQSSGEFDTTAVILGTQLTDSRSVAVADLDGDTVVNDIVIGRMHHATASTLEWYSISGAVATSEATFDAGDVLSVALGDVDGNDEMDILAVNSQGVLQVYTQQASTLALTDAATFSGATALHASEMNDDTLVDYALMRDAGSSTLLFISDNPIAEPEPTPTAAPTPEPQPEPEPETTTTVVVVTTGGGGSMGVLTLLLALGLWARRRVH